MNPMYGNDGVVDQVIGSAYQVVKYVASNMELLIDLGESLETLETQYGKITLVINNLGAINNVSDNTAMLLSVNSNMSLLSAINSYLPALNALNNNTAALLAVPGQTADVLNNQDFKNSVAVATTGNITLSGLPTIDGYVVPVATRVLVKDQIDKKQNGIYVSAVGAWQRAADSVGSNLSTGNMVMVDRGNTNAGKIFRVSTLGTITIGTTDITWENVIPDASTTVKGVARAATKAEVTSGTSPDLYVSAKELAEYTGLGEKNTIRSVGTGVSIVKGKVGVELQLKALVAGDNISIVEDGDQLRISSPIGEVPDVQVYGRTLNGWVLIPSTVSGAIDLSGLDTAGQPITVTDVEVIAFNTAQFSVDTGGLIALRQSFIDSLNGSGGGSSGVDSASNMGTGVGVFDSKLGSDLQFRSLKAGSGISITTPTAGEVLITCNVTPGEVNTAASTGSGSSIVGTKVGTELRFKSLKAGSNVSLTSDTGEVTINAADPGEVNTLTAVGSGHSLVGSKTDSQLGVKTLKAGSNVTIDETSTEITINAAGGGGGSGGVTVTGIDTTLNPITTPDVATLAFDPADFVLDGDASATQVSLRPNAVVKSAAPAENSGKSLIKSMTDSQLKIKTLAAGSNITITDGPNNDSLVISSTGGGGSGAVRSGNRIPVLFPYESGEWVGYSNVASVPMPVPEEGTLGAIHTPSSNRAYFFPVVTDRTGEFVSSTFFTDTLIPQEAVITTALYSADPVSGLPKTRMAMVDTFVKDETNAPSGTYFTDLDNGVPTGIVMTPGLYWIGLHTTIPYDVFGPIITGCLGHFMNAFDIGYQLLEGYTDNIGVDDNAAFFFPPTITGPFGFGNSNKYSPVFIDSEYMGPVVHLDIRL